MLRDVSPRKSPPGDPSGGVVYLRIVLSPEQVSLIWVFLNKVFYREGLLAPRPTPKLEDHPSSAARDCLFNLFAATLLIGGRSSIRHLRTRHAVVTGTHYMAWYAHLFILPNDKWRPYLFLRHVCRNLLQQILNTALRFFFTHGLCIPSINCRYWFDRFVCCHHLSKFEIWANKVLLLNTQLKYYIRRQVFKRH